MRHRISLFVLLVIIVVVGGYLAGCASGGGQPHMQAALDELRGARSELDAALADKGGHREKAMSLIDEAIGEVQAGIDFANAH
jgi:outer membrane murein-binding lipoprotein Lpp